MPCKHPCLVSEKSPKSLHGQFLSQEIKISCSIVVNINQFRLLQQKSPIAEERQKSVSCCKDCSSAVALSLTCHSVSQQFSK